MSKVLCYVRATSIPTQGLIGHRLKTTTSNDDYVLLHIMRGYRFLSASRIRLRLIKHIGCHVFVRKVQRCLVAIGYRSGHRYRWPRVTQNPVIATSPCLSPCWWIVPSKKLMDFAATAVIMPQADSGIISKYHTRPVLVVPVLMLGCQDTAVMVMIRMQSGPSVWMAWVLSSCY